MNYLDLNRNAQKTAIAELRDSSTETATMPLKGIIMISQNFEFDKNGNIYRGERQ